MRHIVFITFLILNFLKLNAQNSETITSRVDNYLKSANDSYKFNGVALVFHENEILLNKGYGYSNMTELTVNGPETRFPILSVTKTITSSLILKLQDDGKLSVKDKLIKYFPDYPNGSKISIHHLLTHSSGIYNYTGDIGIEDSTLVNNPISKEKILNHFKNKPLDFKPGKYYSYNNSGYFLLGLIIEKVTEKPYETVVREYLFKPFEMTNSGFDFINLPKEIIAQGYQFWNQNEAIPYKHYDSTFAYSAGSIYSTTIDLLKWAKVVSSKQLLEPKIWELAFKPKIQNYGFGWQNGRYFGKKYVKHSGGYPGYMSEFIYYPDENLIIILLNNFGKYKQNVWSVGMGITSIVLRLPYDNWNPKNEVEVDKSVMLKHVGVYKFEKTKIEIKLRDDKMYVTISGSPDMRLLAEGEDDYYLENFNTSYNFDDNILTIHEHGKDYRFIRQD